MTTTAYDIHFIASDIAFTDANEKVHLNIGFNKVKRIGKSVIGMAGCLYCMIDWTNSVLNHIVSGGDFTVPQTILDRKNVDFIAIIHINGMCLQYTKPKEFDNDGNKQEPRWENITTIATVIGSGKCHVQGILDDCPNAVVAVLEAIKKDRYTDGEVKYCSVTREDIHNLEIHPMSIQINQQIAGIQKEIEAVNEFLDMPEHKGMYFHANTDVYHVGNPSRFNDETALSILNQGFSEIRNSLAGELT